MYKPDLRAGTGVANAIGFIHRKLNDADIYFVANTSNHDVNDELTIRSSRPGCELWDPFSGETRPAAVKRKGDSSFVPLVLAPYESRVLVFTNVPTNVASRAEAQVPDQGGRSISLDANWTLTFTRTQKKVAMPTLRSWTEDEGSKFYSGEVVYERDVTMPMTFHRASLDFGPGTPVAFSGPADAPGMRALLESPVRESAVVFVNGKNAGMVWHPPYRLDLAHSLHAGSNRLLILVANTAINEISGAALPSYRLLNLRYGERFVPQGFDGIAPLPSGILGPLRLVIE